MIEAKSEKTPHWSSKITTWGCWFDANLLQRAASRHARS
jgi:hypothetical protein